MVSSVALISERERREMAIGWLSCCDIDVLVWSYSHRHKFHYLHAARGDGETTSVWKTVISLGVEEVVEMNTQ